MRCALAEQWHKWDFTQFFWSRCIIEGVGIYSCNKSQLARFKGRKKTSYNNFVDQSILVGFNQKKMLPPLLFKLLKVQGLVYLYLFIENFRWFMSVHRLPRLTSQFSTAFVNSDSQGIWWTQKNKSDWTPVMLVVFQKSLGSDTVSDNSWRVLACCLLLHWQYLK